MSIDNNDTKSFLFSACVFTFLAITRFLLNENYTLLQMSCLNLLALDYALFHIFQQAYRRVKEKVYKSALPSSTKKRKNRCVLLWGLFLFVLVVSIEAIYILNFGNATVNDIISIIALFISIEDNQLAIYLISCLSFIIRM